MFLSHEDLYSIRKTIMGDPTIEDRMIWPHTKNGDYSAKTGYHLLHNLQQVPLGSHIFILLIVLVNWCGNPFGKSSLFQK